MTISTPDPEPCPSCGAEATPVDLGGRILWVCSPCAEDRIARREGQERAEELAELRRRSGLPSAFFDAQLSDLEHDLERKVESAMMGGGTLTIFGPVGTGKTHAGAAALLAWHRRGRSGLLISSARLLLKVRSSYQGNRSRTAEQIADDYARARFLVLDDLGAEKSTETAQEVLTMVIDERIHHRRPTVITTNLSFAQLADAYSDRLASRLAGGLVHKLEGSDRRLG